MLSVDMLFWILVGIAIIVFIYSVISMLNWFFSGVRERLKERKRNRLIAKRERKENRLERKPIFSYERIQELSQELANSVDEYYDDEDDEVSDKTQECSHSADDSSDLINVNVDKTSPLVNEDTVKNIEDLISIVPVKSAEDIEAFGNLKLELVKYHRQFAKNVGIEDKRVEQYAFADTIQHFNDPSYFHFLIKKNTETAGILLYKYETSEVDGEKILYLKNLFVKEEYQGMGIGTFVIKELKKLGTRIELECWYDMPSHEFYEAVGAMRIKTRYTIT